MSKDFQVEHFHKSKLLIEQHFHGCYGVDFSTCGIDDILGLSKILLKRGIGGFYPTLVTDSVENIKRQIGVIKDAASKQTSDMSKILGIHIEGIFINANKKGIHNKKYFMYPTIENYQLLEDEFIKIVTLAPEFDKDFALSKYLKEKGVKVQAGHCSGNDLSKCDGVTHLFNAMQGINHREHSTALSALLNDNIYTEIIADGVHLSDGIIELVLKAKPEDKVILISDSLPLAGLNELQDGQITCVFAGEEIFFDGKKATSAEGTIAGSTAFLDCIIQRLSQKHPERFKKYITMATDNVCKYHNVEIDGCIYWSDDFEIVAVEKDGHVFYRESF